MTLNLPVLEFVADKSEYFKALSLIRRILSIHGFSSRLVCKHPRMGQVCLVHITSEARNNCDITKVFDFLSFVVQPPNFDWVLTEIEESNLDNYGCVVTPMWRVSLDLLLNPR